MSDIFISYASEDRDMARRLAGALEAQGWSVWWDRTIPAGSTFVKVIDVAIAQARCVVVAWSAVSVTKNWVLEEAQDGLDRGILVPIFIERVTPPRGFRRIQAADLSDWDGSTDAPAFQHFVGDLSRILGLPARRAAAPVEATPQQAPAETAKPAPAAQAGEERAGSAQVARTASRRKSVRLVLAAFIVLAVAIGAWLAMETMRSREAERAADARREAMQEAQRRREEEAAQAARAEAARQAAAEEAKRQADAEAERQAAAEETKRQATAEAERRTAAEETKRRAKAEAERRAIAEEARRRAEAEARRARDVEQARAKERSAPRPPAGDVPAGGGAARGWLGVTIQQPTKEVVESLGLPDQQGVLVNAVVAGSAAEKAGIQGGDVILAVDGRPVDARGLAVMIAALPPGTVVALTVRRGSGMLFVAVKLEAQPPR